MVHWCTGAQSTRDDLPIKTRKSGSLGRKNFFPGQGEKIIENILKIFVKIFGGMKNIY
jgi:hypothetical protein